MDRVSSCAVSEKGRLHLAAVYLDFTTAARCWSAELATRSTVRCTLRVEVSEHSVSFVYTVKPA